MIVVWSSKSPGNIIACDKYAAGPNFLLEILPETDRVILLHYIFSVQNVDLRVIVNNSLQCRLGDKSKTVMIEQGTSGPVFKKNGTGLILVWPTNQH